MTNVARFTAIVALLGVSSVMVHVALSMWMHGLIISDAPPPQATLNWIGWAVKLVGVGILLSLLRPGLKWSLLIVPLWFIAVEVLGIAASLAVLGTYGIGL